MRKRGGVGGAVEEMSGGVRVRGAVGAEVVARLADAVEESFQDFGAATTELEEGAPPIARETSL